MNYIIKEIEKEDLYDYISVNTNAWNESYRGIINDEFINKIMNEINHNAEKLKNRFDKNKKERPYQKRFILYVDNEPVGMFSVDKSREDKYPNSGELCSIYLLNKVKKKGFGKILFERAIKELKKMNFKDMVICCIKKNPTNEFYKHMGGKFVYSKNKKIGGQDIIENVYYYEKI